jgi:hypothetical protein
MIIVSSDDFFSIGKTIPITVPLLRIGTKLDNFQIVTQSIIVIIIQSVINCRIQPKQNFQTMDSP